MPSDHFITTLPDDPLILPVLDGLFAEYQQRYGDYFGPQDPEPAHWYRPPEGRFIVLIRHNRPIAMGAFKRFDPQTAELKRIWTDPGLRRQGLARRVLLQLEQHAGEQGYQQLFLTTGFRQPEARQLYLNHGWQPLFDLALDSEQFAVAPYDGRLRFVKALALARTSAASSG